jgi:hypothetical protein
MDSIGFLRIFILVYWTPEDTMSTSNRFALLRAGGLGRMPGIPATMGDVAEEPK